MNFIGHVFIASWRRGTDASVAPYAFGSMIPDFEGMAQAKVERVTHHETAEGVALHHETDRVFHTSPTFLDLMEETQRFLEARGARHGTAMAVAHVGAELLLDGWLLARDAGEGGDVSALYLKALEIGVPLVHHMHFRKGPEAAKRMRALLHRLREYGLEGHQDIDILVGRLERVLESRPMLRIEPEDREAVRASMVACERAVHERASVWMGKLREKLSAEPSRG